MSIVLFPYLGFLVLLLFVLILSRIVPRELKRIASGHASRLEIGFIIFAVILANAQYAWAANQKVSQLSAPAGGPSRSDKIYIVDDPSGTPASTADTIENVLELIEGTTSITILPGSITDHGDATETGSIEWALNNYDTVRLVPGTYTVANNATITFPSGTALIGAGKHVSIIEQANSFAPLLDMTDQCTVQDLGVNCPRDSYAAGYAAIRVSGNSDKQNTIDSVRVYATGAGANGISLGNGHVWVNNTVVITEHVGVSLQYAGNWYFDACDIILTGSNVGANHLGVYGTSALDGGRIYWFGGRIGTGYGYDEVVGDTDKIFAAIYVDADATSGRLSFWSLNSFVRINDGADDATLASIYRDDSGSLWARFFGCFGQSEIPSGTAAWTSKAIINTGGTVETFASRFTRFNGDVMGQMQMGVRTISALTTTLDKFEGGLILLDASSNAVTVNLPANVIEGDIITFKCINADNTVTIGRNGNTIDGAASDITMALYDTVQVVYSGSEWTKINP